MSQSSSPDVTAHRRIVTEATVHYDETDSVSEASMKDDIASPVDQHPGNQPEVVTEALTSRGGGDMGGSEQSPSLPTPDPTPNPAIPRPGKHAFHFDSLQPVNPVISLITISYLWILILSFSNLIQVSSRSMPSFNPRSGRLQNFNIKMIYLPCRW